VSERTATKAFALWPVLAVAGAKTALNLAFAGRYGWHRDELYYAAAGRHIQAGYVDFPPLTPLLAGAERALIGDSLVGLRLLAILAGALVVLIAAQVARELGGGRRAQILAAVVVGFSPILVSTNGLFQPVSFDQLTTMALLLLALRLALGRGNWLLIGLVAGIGLETKYTLIVVLIPLLLAFLIFRRDLLKPRGFALSVGVAFALFLPNLIWQIGHDWASVRFFTNPPSSATAESRPQFAANLLLVTGLVSVPVVVAGVRLLLRDRALRALGWTVIAVVAAYFALNGKSYYAMPVVLFSLAAGAVPLDGWLSPRRLWATATPFAAFFLLFLPVGLPVLPAATAERAGIFDLRSDYPDEMGWPELARTVERVSGGADVLIVGNYGEAGALVVFGHDLPPLASGHLSFRYWRPAVSGRKAVLVGFAKEVHFCKGGARIVARIKMPVENEERGRPIALCTLDRPLEQLWPGIVHWD
jgi:4-amino-4-deoxy-L-arabinose transferase-like glycosyltransferase